MYLGCGDLALSTTVMCLKEVDLMFRWQHLHIYIADGYVKP